MLTNLTAWIRSARGTERLVLVWCVVLVVAGVLLRVQDLGFPDKLTFDERHFVVNARRYLEPVADKNNHPPLGKLFIAASIQVFGDVSWAWRLPSLLSGVLNIVLGAALARVLFKDRLAALMAGAFIAADGFFVTYSRTALMDGVLTAFMLASALACVRARGAGGLALAAVLAGLSMCIKWTGVVLVVPLGLAWLLRRKELPRWTPITWLLVPAAYWAPFAVGLAITDKPIAVWSETQRLYGMHKDLTDWANGWVSHWTTWFLPTRPLTLYHLPQKHRMLRAMTTLPNLVLLWGSTLLGVVSFVRVIALGSRGIRERWASSTEGWFHGQLQGVVWLLLLWLLPFAPWVLTHRDTYVYHYLPSYIFAVILMGAGVARLFRTRPWAGWLLLIAVSVVFAVYAPLWSGLPVPNSRWNNLLFLKMWR